MAKGKGGAPADGQLSESAGRLSNRPASASERRQNLSSEQLAPLSSIRQKLAGAALLSIALLAGAHAASAETLATAQSDSSCRPSMLIERNGEIRIDWTRVHSDEEVKECIKVVNSKIGIDGMKDWFISNYFHVIEDESVAYRLLVSAGWNTKKNGLLFSNGIFIDIINHIFCYSYTIAIVENVDGSIQISAMCNYE